MPHTSPLANAAVRTVLHLSPSVAAAAIVVAQRRGLRMQQWLDSVVVEACVRANRTTPACSLSGDGSAELFVRVATHAPQLLTGPWRALLERAKMRSDLWNFPVQSLEQDEVVPCPAVTLNLERVRAAWPELVAATFAT